MSLPQRFVLNETISLIKKIRLKKWYERQHKFLSDKIEEKRRHQSENANNKEKIEQAIYEIKQNKEKNRKAINKAKDKEYAKNMEEKRRSVAKKDQEKKENRKKHADANCARIFREEQSEIKKLLAHSGLTEEELGVVWNHSTLKHKPRQEKDVQSRRKYVCAPTVNKKVTNSDKVQKETQIT